MMITDKRKDMVTVTLKLTQPEAELLAKLQLVKNKPGTWPVKKFGTRSEVFRQALLQLAARHKLVSGDVQQELERARRIHPTRRGW